MHEPTRIAVAGAAGRMGRSVVALAAEHPDIAVTSAFGRSGAQQRAPMAALLAGAEVIVDFSTPSAASGLAGRVAELAAKPGAPALVIGVTGFSLQEERAIARAAERVAIVKAANFSVGLNTLATAVEWAAGRLAAAEWDIEIIEAHHRRKRDAPSGSALTLGEAAARGRGASLADTRAGIRSGMTESRAVGEIGFAVVRGGGLVGEHSVLFASEEETLTFRHSARDRSVFARGALLAAAWVRGRPPGLYGMADVLSA